MKTNGNDKSLESYRIFPIIAWIITILFAAFVYKIAQELEEITTRLQIQTNRLQEKVDTPAELIEDFNIK